MIRKQEKWMQGQEVKDQDTKICDYCNQECTDFMMKPIVIYFGTIGNFTPHIAHAVKCVACLDES